jgi:molybdopterin converting factor small subunit
MIRQGRIGLTLPPPLLVPGRLTMSHQQECRSSPVSHGVEPYWPGLTAGAAGQGGASPPEPRRDRTTMTDGVAGRRWWHTGAVVTLRLFAQAREAAGTRRVDLPGGTVGDVLDEACHRFGATFGAVLAGSKVWLNGVAAQRDEPVADGDEVAVLPPVSGG